MTQKISNIDYAKLATLIFAENSEENETFEVEYSFNNCELVLTVEHKIKYESGIGGSYENREFEIISEVASESYYISDYQCYNKEYDKTKCDFRRNLLTNILNNLINN